MGHAGDEHDDEARGVSDDEGSERPSGAPPDPLDRLWLHPSELPPAPGAPGPAGPPTRVRTPWATAVVAGAAGAILTLAVLGAIGALDRADEVVDHSAVPTSVPIESAQAVAVTVAHSVVAVSARDKLGARRGSGVCIRSSGEILTSARLIGTATKVEVTTTDGTVQAARIIGRDATTDLVLLALGTGLRRAPAAARTPHAGDPVWVVGAPRTGDTSPWMSTGVVASTDSIVATDTGPITSGLLETAAASSNSSSGGALVDRSGHVAGIVLWPVGDNRVTYAVPIATALSIANDLRANGYATHGALGINGIDKPLGPTVTSLVSGGPAARAGIRVGDVVTSVGERRVDSMEEVMALVRHASPGRPLEVELKRGSTTVKLRATVTRMPPAD